MFSGLHERQLDDKGRIALPAAFRRQLGERCYLAFGENRCIDVLSTDAFEELAARIREQVRLRELPMSRQRALHHTAAEVPIDAQGRVKVEERLREYAQLPLSSKVVVAGNDDRIELWSESVYADVAERISAGLARGDE
jgi:MraZ protein